MKLTDKTAQKVIIEQLPRLREVILGTLKEKIIHMEQNFNEVNHESASVGVGLIVQDIALDKSSENDRSNSILKQDTKSIVRNIVSQKDKIFASCVSKKGRLNRGFDIHEPVAASYRSSYELIDCKLKEKRQII